jgi:hypothetical protein
MCFGGGKSKPVTAPPPTPPTTFDYSAANRGQDAERQAVNRANAAQTVSTTAPSSFGSELSK